MRLFKYELYKIITKKLFWGFLVIAIIINALALWWLNPPPDGLTHVEVKNVFDTLRTLSLSDKLEFLDEFASSQEELGTRYHEDFWIRQNSRNHVVDSIRYELTINTYSKFLERINYDSDTFLSSSVFGNDLDSFSVRNIIKTQEDFEKMSDIDIRYDVNDGLAVLFDSPSTDIIIILLILIITLALITDEKDKKLFLLVKSTPNGHFFTIIAKLSAMAVCVVGVSTIVLLSGIVFAEVTYGLGDVTRSIQSVPFLMNSTLQVSVIEFMFLHFFTKTAGFLCIGMIIMLIAIYAKHSVILILSTALFAVVNILLGIIPVLSDWSFLRFFNFFTLIRPHHVYGGYFNLNIFDNPVNLTPLFMIFGVFIFAVVFTLVCLSYVKKRGIESDLNLFKIKRFRIFSSITHTSWKYFEFKKLAFTNKSIFIIAVFVLIQGYSIFNAQEPYLSNEHHYIKTTLIELQGSLTNKKETLILAQKEVYDKAVAEIEKIDSQVKNGEIDLVNAFELRTPHQEVVDSMNGFLYIYERYEYVRDNENAQFLYDAGYARLFGITDTEAGLNSGMILIFIMILCLCSVFSIEYKTGMYKVLNSTPFGIINTIRAKLLLSAVITFVCYIVAFLPDIIYIGRFFGYGGVNLPISSVYPISNINIPIWEYMIVLYLFRFAVFIGIMMIILALSLKIRNNAYTALCAAGILLLPLFIHSFDINLFDWVSLLYLITANGIITSFDLAKSFQIIVFITISAMCARFIYKKFGKI